MEWNKKTFKKKRTNALQDEKKVTLYRDIEVSKSEKGSYYLERSASVHLVSTVIRGE